MKNLRYFFIISLCFFVVLGIGSSVQADFPDGHINYIVPFNPGGETDLTARSQEPHFEDIFGVDVVISYTTGGGGAVGWSEIMGVEPDGYTIIGYNLPHIALQTLMRDDPGYHALDFEDICWFQFTPNLLAVHKDSDIDTLEDFVEQAKEFPEALTLGGSGNWTANHVGTLMFEDMAGIDVTYIPYSGSGAAVPALLGRHVTGLMTYTTMALQHGDLKPLAVAAEERVEGLEDVPTFKELGYDYVDGAFRGMAAPPGTSEDRLEILAEGFRELNEHPAIVEFYRENGFVNLFYGPEEASAHVEQLLEDYREILEDLGEI